MATCWACTGGRGENGIKVAELLITSEPTIVDYDELADADLFALESSEHLVIDGKSYESRAGLPPRAPTPIGDPSMATRALGL